MHTKGLIQKIFALVLILVIPIFIVTNYSILRSKRDLSCTFHGDFVPKNDYLVEKTFVFILYGISDYTIAEQTLTSILGQKYDHYRIIFIETRASEPYLFSLRQLAAREGKQDRLFFMHVDKEISWVHAFRTAVESCKDDEIIIQMDPFDWLAHENVLTKLNHIYGSSDDVWLTYSQYLEYPSYRKGNIEPYLKRMLRNRHVKKLPWLSSHFKTYYAGLFKQVKLETENYYTNKYEAELDLFMLPLSEKAKNHIRYIDDILYIRNTVPAKS